LRGKPLILRFEGTRSFFYGSFVAQRHQGIGANGFAGRYITCEQSHKDQQQRSAKQARWVGLA
jgi:hypothetical protein